jgi:predicted RNA binding protein YcfA (HicA-like mRNA interferase family)
MSFFEKGQRNPQNAATRRGDLIETKGGHRQFKHATKLGPVTVPGKPSDDLAPGTLNSVLKQTCLK